MPDSRETAAAGHASESGVLHHAGDRLPVTRASLREDLARIGVGDAMTLLVHCALSRLGWVAGGAQAVVLALADAVGPRGNLVMPAQSGQLSDPADWRDPPVPEAWWPILKKALPAYDPDLTPTRNMGAVAELFRTRPGARRSAHPLVSFAACGPAAGPITGTHPLNCRFGEQSPLARLYDMGAHILLLGVDHANSTALHLAEHRASFPAKRRERTGAPMDVDGAPEWRTFEDLAPRSDDFAAIGEAFAASGGPERRGPVGWGQGRLCRLPDLVDFAVGWMEANR